METDSEASQVNPPTSGKTMGASQSPSADLETKTQNPNQNDLEPVTGIKLILLLISLTLACFLILLDTSIISTVGETMTEQPYSRA